MKKIIRNLLNKFGYDFVKINVHGKNKIGKVEKVQIGDFEILMPGINAQISLYKYNPTANMQMGRLAQLVQNKYAKSTMIDIGANVGDTIAVVRCKTTMPIIAIEGDAFSFSFLQKNVAQFKEVITICEYLGEEKKAMQVTMEKEGWNNTIIPAAEGNVVVNLKTVDDVIEENNLGKTDIKLLKIDTEGFDTIILRGCNKTIKQNNPVLYFEYNGENMNTIGENGFNTLMQLKHFGYNNIHIFDCIDNLILTTTLNDTSTLQQLHNYAYTKNTMIPYFDICIFHTNDDDLAKEFLNQEKQLTV
jgi:FkbM family methyltransferase